MQKLALLFCILTYLANAQELSLEDFKRASEQNLKKYSLAELMGFDPTKQKGTRLFWISEVLKANPENFLFLNHLTEISLEQSNILAQWQGYLFLNGISSLNEETSTALAQWQGKNLSLNGLNRLEEVTAKALAQWTGWSLYLNRLSQMDEETAKALVVWQGRYLHLEGITPLNETTASVLSQFTGKIFAKDEILEQINNYK